MSRRVLDPLDRGRTIGYYVTRRHEAQIRALAAHYTRRERRRISHSEVVQLLVERDVHRLKLPEPAIVDDAPVPDVAP